VFKMKSKLRDRIWVFATSALIATLLLLTYQSVIYAAKMDVKDRQNDKVKATQTAEWNTIDVVIKDTIDKAGMKLDNEVIPAMLDDITKTYGNDKNRLKHDLENISNTTYDNPLVHILAKDINNKYMYDIKSDSNDIFILTKNAGIISDPSVSTSSSDRPRSLEAETGSHYNKELANQAFSAIVNQSRRVNNPVIFWQFFAPDNNNQKKISTMSLSGLKDTFTSQNGDLMSLDSYEFLVPRYIFFDSDLLGDKLVNDRGVRQDIYQIVLVQGFNVTEVIQQTHILDSIYTGINNNTSSLTDFISMTRVQQILLFVGLFTITVWVQFAVRTRRKYVDENLELALTS
jgi:hypothetical protein